MRIVSVVARSSVLHFVVLGGLLFAGSSLLAKPMVPAGREPIVITAARVREIRDDYTRMMGIAPTPAELAALVKREADDEMLYREALLLGLDRGDQAVAWRVIEKAEFLYDDLADDQSEALRRGLELGLQHDDVVVRRGLITKMRLLAKGLSRNSEPSGAELEAALQGYLDGHRGDFVQPALVSLVHVFLRGDARREPEARALRARLEAAHTPPQEAVGSGDPFIAGSVIRASSHAGLAKVFGDELADAVSTLPLQTWSQPIRSPYGLHLVWITQRRDARLPALAAVRSQVLRAYRAERQQQALQRMLEEVRGAYEVRIQNEVPANG